MNETAKQLMSDREFALLGGGEIGYIREISGEKAAQMFGVHSEIPTDQVLFALYAADGSCMAVGDNINAVLANALDQNLRPVSLH